MKASYEQLCDVIVKNPSIRTIGELVNKASEEGFTEATFNDLDMAIGWSMQARRTPILAGKRTGNATFWWFIHNAVAHPLTEVLHHAKLYKAAAWIHDETIPIHDITKEGRG